MTLSLVWLRRCLGLARVAFVVALMIVMWLSVIDVSNVMPERLSDKLAHALAFAWLASLAEFAFPAPGKLRVWAPALGTYGLIIECIQWMLPWREFSLLDWGADITGVLVWVLLAVRLRRSLWMRHYAAAA